MSNRIRASPCDSMAIGMYVETENGREIRKKILCLHLKFPFTV